MTVEKKIMIGAIAFLILFLAFLGFIFRAAPNEANVDRFIDNRVDKILWRYEELIIKDGYFYDKNGVRYEVTRDED